MTLSHSFGSNIQTLVNNSITIGCNRDDKQPLTNGLNNSIIFGANVLIPTISIVVRLIKVILMQLVK
jgi:hypothetical protein